ncbi:MAG: paraquat-inducible protein A [Pseudomonadota bacterium]
MPSQQRDSTSTIIEPEISATTGSESEANSLLACHECDLLIPYPNLKKSEKAYCPRCGYLLLECREDSINQTIAYALTGLIAFYPAVFYPMIGLEAMGLSSTASLFETIRVLYNNQLFFVALSVSLFAVIIPLCQLLIVSYLLFRLTRGHYSQHFVVFYRAFYHFKHWGMLEVFLLGIIVSLYKLVGLASVEYGVGLAAFVILLLSAIMVSRVLDEHLVWELIEREKNRKARAN